MTPADETERETAMTQEDTDRPPTAIDDGSGHSLSQTVPSGPDVITVASERPLSAAAHERLRALRRDSNCGLQGSSVLYLSTPITTGPKLLDWLAANRDHPDDAAGEGVAEVVRDEVIEENLAQLGPLRDRIRAEWPDAFLIDPTDLTVSEWSQWEYHRFWVEVLNQLVDTIVFADGWELSTGCTIEYATGLLAGIPMHDARGNEITPSDAAHRFRLASETLLGAGRDRSMQLAASARAEIEASTPLKDSSLADLAASNNVASFVSVTPRIPVLRYRFIRGRNVPRGVGLHDAVRLLLAGSSSKSVNIRTFKPGSAKGNPFKYGLSHVDDVLRAVHAYAESGFYCIVNETVAVDDGGVSGVTLGGIAEFAPDDTPRVVEQGDTASLPALVAQKILRTVYHSGLEIPFGNGERVEFSVHPSRVGHKAEHVLVWEREDVSPVSLDVPITWPNRFSGLLGDKTYGLLVADALGAPVPATTAVLRRLAPFRFGRSTGTGDWWMRTAPATQTPGHFTTTAGWSDPFAALTKEDPDADVSGVLAQEGVNAAFSGATLPVTGARGHLIEGVQGAGDGFMLGDTPTTPLPIEVETRVRNLLNRLESALGSDVRIEWADDGQLAWVLQLHRVPQRNSPGVFSDGEAVEWLLFDPSKGLDALRDLIAQARESGAGIEVVRPIGLTSHVGDLLRKAAVPGRLSMGAVSGQPSSKG